MKRNEKSKRKKNINGFLFHSEWKMIPSAMCNVFLASNIQTKMKKKYDSLSNFDKVNVRMLYSVANIRKNEAYHQVLA